MASETKYRINNLNATLMVCVAVIMDLLGPVGTVLGTGIFYVWYKILDIPIFSPKQLTRWGLNLLGEAATAGVWAGMTVGVVLMIMLTRTEDRLGIDIAGKINVKNPGKAAGKVSTAAQRTERKAARRTADPQRAARAQERLERLRAKKAEGAGISSRLQVQDINVPKNT